MALERLRVDALRCLRQVDIALDPSLNYVFGPNGSGKTSLLESIHLLGRGRSFRTRQAARLLQRGAKVLSVYGETSGDDARRRKLGIQFSEGHLRVRIDGAAAESLTALTQALPVHIIDPKLHDLIEAGPSERRRYLDAGVFHVEHTYLGHWRTYRRVLGQRNAALKAGHLSNELDAWTLPLIAAGDEVHGARKRYVDALAPIVDRLGRRLLNTDLMLQYRPGWRQGIELAEALTETHERDQSTGFTQVGPHRANLKIRFESGDVKDAASRGQQKLVAAALVLAQVEQFELATGNRGTLLVDDPAAELDVGALERLLVEIDGVRAQRVLTGLGIDRLRPEPGYPVFHVEQGEVQPVL